MEAVAGKVTICLSHAVEIMSAVIIGFALVRALFSFISTLHKNSERREAVRVQFGTSVALALELLLGADVLATAVAPSWDDIGKPAAIAVLRTALNHFLEKELHRSKQRPVAAMEPEQKRA